MGVGWLVGPILTALEDSRAAHPRASGGIWLRGLLVKTAFVLGLGFVGLLTGAWVGDATCTKSGEPGDFLYGLECLDDALAGAVGGAFVGLGAGVVGLVLAPWRRRRQ